MLKSVPTKTAIGAVRFKNKKTIRKNAKQEITGNNRELVRQVLFAKRITEDSRKCVRLNGDRSNAVSKMPDNSRFNNNARNKIAGIKSSDNVPSRIAEIRFNDGLNKVADSRFSVSVPNNSVAGLSSSVSKINAVSRRSNKIAVNKNAKDKSGLISVSNRNAASNSKDRFSVVRLSSNDRSETDVIRFIIGSSKNACSRNAGDIINSKDSGNSASKKRVGDNYNGRDALLNIVINSVISNNCTAINGLCRGRVTTII